MDILQGSLKGAGVGSPRVSKDKPAGKATSLAEQRALAATQGEKKKSLLPLEQVQEDRMLSSFARRK